MRRQLARGAAPTVYLLPGVADALDRNKQPLLGHERGGILLGRVYGDELVVVEDITEPGPGDRAGRFFFDRNRERAQKIIEEAWQRSKGEKIYLGEWHSHPEDFPNPSSRDKAMIRNMFTQSKMTFDGLLLMIVGRKANWQGFQSPAGLNMLPAPCVLKLE